MNTNTNEKDLYVKLNMKKNLDLLINKGLQMDTNMSSVYTSLKQEVKTLEQLGQVEEENFK